MAGGSVWQAVSYVSAYTAGAHAKLTILRGLSECECLRGRRWWSGGCINSRRASLGAGTRRVNWGANCLCQHALAPGTGGSAERPAHDSRAAVRRP
jgi:hypothetical protein